MPVAEALKHLFVVALALGSLLALAVDVWRGPAPVLTARVVEVVDGDTVVLDFGDRLETVRLLGVDTPETVHPDRPVECFGPEASAFAREHLGGRSVRVELDTVRRDYYGRLLAYLHTDAGRFNDRILAEGYGRLLVLAPQLRHGRALLTAELEAQAARRGLWERCVEM